MTGRAAQAKVVVYSLVYDKRGGSSRGEKVGVATGSEAGGFQKGDLYVVGVDQIRK